MKSLQDLARHIGVNHSFLLSLIVNADKFYNTYYIKKSSGEPRQIDAPSQLLKAIQSWILRNILEKIEISDRAYGFVRKRGIKLNAKLHLGKKCVLCLDIKDFFLSTKEIKVRKVFHKLYNKKELVIGLSNLCLYKKYLPQGAVTSPYLTNVIFKPADDAILLLCNKKDIDYSRYADDMTFSSNDYEKLKDIIPQVGKICKRNGYTLNRKKTRIMTGKRRVSVTGIVLNSGKLSIGRNKKKEIRSAIYNYIVKKDKTVNIKSLIGNLSFLRDIEFSTYKKLVNYKNKLRNNL